jgi:kynurenine formamidase/predicted enzyme related to lactoylglutathione lyase
MPRFIDLSHDVYDGMVTYPGLPAPRLSSVLTREQSRGRYADGVEFDIGSIELCANTGTYLDTPFHRYAGGHDLSGLSLERCTDLAAVVIHGPRVDGGATTGPVELPAELLQHLGGAALLFHTGWDVHWATPDYVRTEHPFVDEPTVRAAIAAGVALVGIDSLNIDSTAGSDRPAHSLLLAAGIPIVEHLTNLASVPTLGARFTATPVKVRGMGTFPVRAFATLAERGAVCEVVFDGADVELLASFWATVLGASATDVRSDAWATVRDPRPGGVTLAFQRVPESKVAKNRVHLDIWSDDITADAARLVGEGATIVGSVQNDEAGTFQILLDPEGNEFCLVSD